jgi:hypothetical protein
MTTAEEVWLTSFDPDDAWPPVRVRLGQRVQVGERPDYAWAHAESPVPLRDPRTPVRDFIVGPRHRGECLDRPTRWPIHVYLLVPRDAVPVGSAFTIDEVRLTRWGLLHRERPTTEATPRW